MPDILGSIAGYLESLVEGFYRWLEASAAPEKVAASIVVAIIGLMVAKLIERALEAQLPRWLPLDLSRAVTRITVYTILFLAFLGVLRIFNVDLTGLLLAGGFAGIIIGFASQTVVSNLLSGLFLYFDRPLKVNDAVDIGGVSGIVTDIHVLSTRIRTWDGVYVRIPNEKVFTSNIKNFTSHAARRVEYKVTISYSSSIERAIETIMSVLENHPYVLAEPGPQVFADELGDNGVTLSIRFWAPTPKWFTAKTELLGRIKEELDKAGVEIPYPQRVNWFPRPVRVVVEENRAGEKDND